MPCRFGQSMTIHEKSTTNLLEWRSLDDQGQPWFEGQFSLAPLALLENSDDEIGQRLLRILKTAQLINPRFLGKPNAIVAETTLEFPRNWGLGTSSTLIYMVAKWANVDPFVLQFQTLGGSAYDIACAGATAPLLYEKRKGEPILCTIDFDPPFKKNLGFVYLGKKQNSREAIDYYRNQAGDKQRQIAQITELTKALAEAKDLPTFEQALKEHETIIADNLKLEKVQDLYFSDYWGVVKSLGAWGGDFVLVTSDVDADFTRAYFADKGFEVFLTYEEMIYAELKT